ncbi:CD0415/CD1112 family protein [Erysipelothrix rhusiopathiae]|nr:CD0415/CD1112 family protein [Erysipelothrix rhusiopathiae]
MLNNLLFHSMVIGAWWNPFSWGDKVAETVQSMIEGVQNMINGMLVGSVSWSLNLVNSMFNNSLDALRSEVVMTPAQFDINLVSTLEGITKSAVLPIAIILITYIFAYEIYEMFTASNKGAESFGAGELMQLIIKTTVMIALATNAFTIGMAFSDLGSWIVKSVPEESIQVSADLSQTILDSLKPEIVYIESGEPAPPEIIELTKDNRQIYMWDFKLGEAMGTALVSFIAVIFTMIMAGMMYIIAWSRMIMLLLYISVAPIPMATLMNTSWIGSIGQNYLKNLLALMLQGFMMLVLLVIYAGLMNRINGLITSAGNPIYGMVMLIVSMAIIVSMLMKTHNLSKSVMGAS